MALLLFNRNTYFYQKSSIALMKKIILFLFLSIVSISFSSCMRNDDDIYLPIQNSGRISYDGAQFALSYVVVTDMGQDRQGFYYDIQISESPFPRYGQGYTRALLYARLYQEKSVPFSGVYLAGGNTSHQIDIISYYEGVTTFNGAVDHFDFKLYDDQIKSGRMRIDQYQTGIINLDFEFIDVNNYPVLGNYRGTFEYR